jgi:glycosyltransferase involved in cell wall biosynthesis
MMRILLLAPHPFYQDRGTPIAVRYLLNALSARGDVVDLVTFPEGSDIELPQLSIHRTAQLPFTTGVQPGFSWKKVVLDLFFLLKSLRLALTRRYDLVHAVEESVFIALLIKSVKRLPYVYDLDSSLTDQLMTKASFLRLFSFPFRILENLAIRGALAVVPVCDALAEIAWRGNANKVVVLTDVSLIDHNSEAAAGIPDSGLRANDFIYMYVGNLQPYQGVDMLLEAFRILAVSDPEARLVIVGGVEKLLVQYRARVRRMGLENSVQFWGHVPVENLSACFSRADVLISPRIQGQNTPMKIFSYLHSGVPVLATDLKTHTQVLDQSTAMLVPPDAKDLAAGMKRLRDDAGLRERLGRAGKRLVERKYSCEAFTSKVNALYNWLAEQTDGGRHRGREY